MLKQKPHSSYQPSIFTKKPKKRSTSTSANKENISISHNNSSSMDHNPNMNPKSQLNTKNSKNSNPNKEKARKNKKQQIRQRSTSKLLSVTNNLTGEYNKPGAIKLKQCESLIKKTKKSRNNSSSLILVDKIHPHAKSSLKDYSNEFSIKNTKYLNMPNHAQLSKSSTIVSSTGNIQFSQWSKEDQQEKNYNLLSINHIGFFSKPSRLSSMENEVKSARTQLTIEKLKLTPKKAAIMIQKTWRGYLTRKLLEEYIHSFQPMYEEQLKDIRSGRQSRQQARSIISSHRKNHEKSSFFDSSQISQCSEIQPIDSHISESFRTTSNPQKEHSSLFFTENNHVEQNSKELSQFKHKSKNLSGKLRGNEEICDFPVQYFKKPITLSSTKREQQGSVGTNNDEFSCSSRRKNAMKITPDTASRVSEFTLKQKVPTTCDKQEPSIQQTLKYPHSHSLHTKFSTLSLSSKKIAISISPFHLSPIQELTRTCASLSTLFHSFNSACINQLKTQIKQNNLSVNGLMERKDALKDIVDNGMDFVRNVQDQIAKAFDQMKRIVKEGCESSTERGDNVEESQLESHNQEATERSEFPKTVNPKKHSQSPNQKISNQKYMHQLQSPVFSSYDSEMDSSSSRKPKKGKKIDNKKKVTSQFYTIQLPTQEYSAKGKSPIQQEYDEQDSSSQSSHSSQPPTSDHQPSLTLRMHPLYGSHQQSIQILNQFLLNLIEQYQQISTLKNISELEYLCETLKRVSCDSQNKTIIDRCLIEFIVEIMSETWTLREIYDGFRKIVQLGVRAESEEDFYQENQREHEQYDEDHFVDNSNDDDWKLLKTIRKWIEELYKWEMNIIQEVPSKMQSSSFINTENISLNTENLSLHELRQAVNNLSNPTNFQLDLNTHYK